MDNQTDESLAAMRRRWNAQQKELRRLLGQPDKFDEAIRLFLRQHAALHAAEMTPSEQPTYADAVLARMNEAHIRRISRRGQHSVAWLLWHMARIEDVTMNRLVAGGRQLLHQGDWLARMKVTNHHQRWWLDI